MSHLNLFYRMLAGGGMEVAYGVCESAGSAEVKEVQIDGFSLSGDGGSYVIVTFKNANTVNYPKLNVSGTGDVPIYYHGSLLTTSAPLGNGTYAFVHDGNSRWQLVGDVGGGSGTVIPPDPGPGPDISSVTVTVNDEGMLIMTYPDSMSLNTSLSISDDGNLIATYTGDTPDLNLTINSDGYLINNA